MSTDIETHAHEKRAATRPIIGDPDPDAPLESMISNDPWAQERAMRSGLYTIPKTSGKHFSATDVAAALFAVIILLVPLAMAAWGAHHVSGGA
jgi:hypothetical protein